jgi:hypothetical protein
MVTVLFPGARRETSETACLRAGARYKPRHQQAIGSSLEHNPSESGAPYRR